MKNSSAAELIRKGRLFLGIEFGSTRIKAVLIDDACRTLAQGSHGWENRLEGGYWTYHQDGRGCAVHIQPCGIMQRSNTG